MRMLRTHADACTTCGQSPAAGKKASCAESIVPKASVISDVFISHRLGRSGIDCKIYKNHAKRTAKDAHVTIDYYSSIEFELTIKLS